MIDWSRIPNFSPEEFTENPNKYAEPDLIYNIQKTRSLFNKPIFPSPVDGALARTYGSQDSQHYIGSFIKPERLSTALDWFCPSISGHKVFWILYGSCLWTGIGVYFNGRWGGSPCLRYHTDIRPEQFQDRLPLIWYKYRNKTKYPQLSISAYHEFFNLLNQER